MSKVFYDHLVDLTDVERAVKKHIKNPEARDEIFHLIDEIVHHRVTGCVLNCLPEEHHEDFVKNVHEKPHDENLMDYLKQRVVEDVEEFVKNEAKTLSQELIQMLDKDFKKTTKKK